MKDTKKVNYTLIHSNFTDELFDFLLTKGRKVLTVHYGYYKELDLIEWVM